MSFIRENMFLLVLLAAVLVVGGTLVALDFSTSDEVEARMDHRKKISDELQSRSKERVNSNMVSAMKINVEEIQRTAKELAAEQTELNHKPYKVIQLPVQGKPVDAFPYVLADYRREGLALKFIDLFQAEPNLLRDQLHATAAPSEKELTDEAKKQEALLAMHIERLKASDPNAPGVNTTDLPKLASLTAADTLMQIKATKGSIFVDEAALAWLALPTAETNPTAKRLWECQFKLWIVQDIVGAIVAANDEAFDKAKADRTVPYAAVKRLVQIKIDDAYYQHGGSAAAAAGPSGTPSHEAPASEGDDLTRRAGTPEYDVIHYSFSVVMPSDQLLLLERKLMEGRHHTVLETQIGELPKEPKFYYGETPVVLVTISGEALLFSAWERDLMPTEFLKTISAANRRPVDQQRVAAEH